MGHALACPVIPYQEITKRRTRRFGIEKRLSQHFQFQVNYQLSEDLADDDNERDPFTYRYAVANNFKPDYGFSDRMERHRFNAFGLWQAPWGIEFSPLISYHSPQPISVANRILANGYIVKRNTLWKDNFESGRLDRQRPAVRRAASRRAGQRWLQIWVFLWPDAFEECSAGGPEFPSWTPRSIPRSPASVLAFPFAAPPKKLGPPERQSQQLHIFLKSLIPLCPRYFCVFECDLRDEYVGGVCDGENRELGQPVPTATLSAQQPPCFQ